MMKQTLIFIFLLAIAVLSNGQNAAFSFPGESDMQAKKYCNAEKKIMKALAKDSTNTINWYAAYRFYADSQNPACDNDKAYINIVQALERYNKLSNLKRTLLERDGLNREEITNCLSKTTERGLELAKKANTEESYSHFLYLYSKASEKQKDIAEDCLNRLSSSNNNLFITDYNTAVKTNSIKAYQEYAKKYPDSPYAATAEMKARMLQFALDTDSDDWHSFEHYIETHPENNEQVAEAKRIIAELSIETKNADGLQYALKTCDPSYKDAILEALHTIYVNSDKIAVFDAIYGSYVSDSILRKDSEALNAIASAQINNRSSIIKAINATAPYRISYDMLLYMIELDAGRKKWEYVRKTIDQFANTFDGCAEYKSLRNIIYASEQKHLDTTFCSTKVNTAQGDEQYPIVTPDETTMYFAARNRTGNIGKLDIFSATKGKDGNWHNTCSITGDVNTTLWDEIPCGISPDGQTLLSMQNNWVLMSHMTPSGWSTATPLPKNLNIGKWVGDASITPDGRAMLFSAKTKTEQEITPSENIYVATLNDDGSWSDPIPLGPIINTYGTDRYPRMHADMRTLYFASNRHSNIGGLDIFKSTRLSDDSWTEWSEPVNIGKELNTIGDDNPIAVTVDGKRAYTFAKNGESTDICTVKLPKQVRPNPVAVFKGKATDNEGNPIATFIKWEDLSTGKQCGIYRTNPTDGSYYITLPTGKHYGLYISDSVNYPTSLVIDLRDSKGASTIERDIKTTSINQMVARGLAMPLYNIFSEPSKADIAQQSITQVQRIATLIRNPNLKATILYCQEQPSNDKPESIGQQCANTLRSCLGYYGCDIDRITIKAIPLQSDKATKDKNQLELVLHQ